MQSEVPPEWLGERREESLDDTRDESVTIGWRRSDFHAGAHAQIWHTF